MKINVHASLWIEHIRQPTVETPRTFTGAGVVVPHMWQAAGCPINAHTLTLVLVKHLIRVAGRLAFPTCRFTCQVFQQYNRHFPIPFQVGEPRPGNRCSQHLCRGKNGDHAQDVYYFRLCRSFLRNLTTAIAAKQ